MKKREHVIVVGRRSVRCRSCGEWLRNRVVVKVRVDRRTEWECVDCAKMPFVLKLQPA